jgi:ABC-type oligopeptide transport system substrate-binding subunit
MRERSQSFDIDRQQGNDTILYGGMEERDAWTFLKFNMSAIKRGSPRKPKPEERLHPVKQQSPVQ